VIVHTKLSQIRLQLPPYSYPGSGELKHKVKFAKCLNSLISGIIYLKYSDKVYGALINV